MQSKTNNLWSELLEDCSSLQSNQQCLSVLLSTALCFFIKGPEISQVLNKPKKDVLGLSCLSRVSCCCSFFKKKLLFSPQLQGVKDTVLDLEGRASLISAAVLPAVTFTFWSSTVPNQRSCSSKAQHHQLRPPLHTQPHSQIWWGFESHALHVSATIMSPNYDDMNNQVKMSRWSVVAGLFAISPRPWISSLCPLSVSQKQQTEAIFLRTLLGHLRFPNSQKKKALRNKAQPGGKDRGSSTPNRRPLRPTQAPAKENASRFKSWPIIFYKMYKFAMTVWESARKKSVSGRRIQYGCIGTKWTSRPKPKFTWVRSAHKPIEGPPFGALHIHFHLQCLISDQ